MQLCRQLGSSKRDWLYHGREVLNRRNRNRPNRELLVLVRVVAIRGVLDEVVTRLVSICLMLDIDGAALSRLKYKVKTKLTESGLIDISDQIFSKR